MKLFMDTEFTGLHQKTTLISIAMISEDNRDFYAEFTDYDYRSIKDDTWIRDNVLRRRRFHPMIEEHFKMCGNLNMKPYKGKKGILGDSLFVRGELERYLKQFKDIEIWSDCLAYDWVLFCELFGGAMKLPNNVSYIPQDICALFHVAGIDPDISREDFTKLEYDENQKHRADWDAFVIKECYYKLMDIIRKKK